jgi:hypothetical protein
MFSVVAPASTATRSTSHMKSKSERDASSGENSMSSVNAFAYATAPAASSRTWSGVMRSLCFMCVSLVAMKTCMRARSASQIASQHRSMSARAVRDSPVITGPRTPRAIAWTASKSPWLATGKPASM